MSYAHIILERLADGIALLTINRPGKLNALNEQTLRDLDRVFQEAGEDSSIRGLVLTGAGKKAFAAGADIEEVAAATPAQAEQLSRYGQGVFRRLELLGKPSVAAINGFALGGGLELAMACTFRVAAGHAKFGQPEVRLGLITGYGGSLRLPQLVGRGVALHLLLTGTQIDAQEAHRIGLVNQVTPEADLLSSSQDLLRTVLRNAPLAVGWMMRVVDTGCRSSFEEGMRYESAIFGLLAASRDRQEGIQAFLEKRTAQFTGQ